MRLPTIRENGDFFTIRQGESTVEHIEIPLHEYIRIRREHDYWSRLLIAYKLKYPTEKDVESCNVVCWGDKYYLEIWRRKNE